MLKTYKGGLSYRYTSVFFVRQFHTKYKAFRFIVFSIFFVHEEQPK
jgi:hypothetical protein